MDDTWVVIGTVWEMDRLRVTAVDIWVVIGTDSVIDSL